MFPFVRLAKEMFKARKMPPLGLDELHVTHHICWPWDLDMFAELNNGRTLTIYDLGRLPMAQRAGFIPMLKKNRWGMTMAGATVRYRRRVTAFHRFEMRSGVLGRDARFLYLHQTMWRNGEALSSIIYRVAVTDKSGIVPTQKVAEALGHQDWNPKMPDWVDAWISAENSREWPPVY